VFGSVFGSVFGNVFGSAFGQVRGRATSLVAVTVERIDQHPRLARLVTLVRRIVLEQGRQRVGLSASGVAFWFTIALYPALIAAVMVLGLLIDPARVDTAIKELQSAAPGSLSVSVLEQVSAAASAQPTTLSIGFAVALITIGYSASAAVYNLARAVRLAYGLPPQMYVVARAKAFGSGLLGILVLGAVVVATAVASAVASRTDGMWRWLTYALIVVAGLALLTGVLAWQFRLATGRRRPRPRYAIGAALAAIGVYLGFASSYQAIYGALAGSIILMLVFYVTSYVILLGALLNAELDRATSAPGSAPSGTGSSDTAPSGTETSGT
jgi:membrane protein